MGTKLAEEFMVPSLKVQYNPRRGVLTFPSQERAALCCESCALLAHVVGHMGKGVCRLSLSVRA